MEFETWEPAYRRILRDFGFERRADERARDELGSLAQPFDVSRLDDANGATVAVVGAGPNLADQLDLVREADLAYAASTAADTLLKRDLQVDLMVTDLDKNPETARELTGLGTPVAVHAHGDNVTAIREHATRFRMENVLATTQAAPMPVVRNFGGFTDGDRAAFLADHLGADRLVFPGWDFDDDSVNAMKRRKIEWAERLLYWLETRRGEQFNILDGRRDSIDVAGLPL